MAATAWWQVRSVSLTAVDLVHKMTHRIGATRFPVFLWTFFNPWRCPIPFYIRLPLRGIVYASRYAVMASVAFLLARGDWGRPHANAPLVFDARRHISRELAYSGVTILCLWLGQRHAVWLWASSSKFAVLPCCQLPRLCFRWAN